VDGSAVIPALAEVLQELRDDQGVTREQVAVAAEHIDSADAVRYFERGLQAQSVDKMVEAYARVTGISPLDIWRRAIARAADVATSPGADEELSAEEMGRVIDVEEDEEAAGESGS
jgi:predicted RNA methylase